VSVNILGSRRLLAVVATASLWTLWTRPVLYGQTVSPTPLAAAIPAAPAPPPSGAPATGATAEAERVIVTGSNIPTAEEVGPNPVTTLNRDYIHPKDGHSQRRAVAERSARK